MVFLRQPPYYQASHTFSRASYRSYPSRAARKAIHLPKNSVLIHTKITFSKFIQLKGTTVKSVGTLNLIQSIQRTFSVLYVFPPMERVPLGQKKNDPHFSP